MFEPLNFGCMGLTKLSLANTNLSPFPLNLSLFQIEVSYHVFGWSIRTTSNLGEFIGAIAVVLTLFYLATQVKHSKEATEANTKSLEEDRKIALVQWYQSIRDAQIGNQRILVDSPYLPGIVLKRRREGISALCEEKLYRVNRFSLSVLLIQDVGYFAYQNGLDPEFPMRLEKQVQVSGFDWRNFGMLDSIHPGLKTEIERILGDMEQQYESENEVKDSWSAIKYSA